MALLIVCDTIFINMALIMSVALWYGGIIPGEVRTVIPVPVEAWQWLLWMGIAATILNVATLAAFRLYSQLWRYAGVDELLKIFAATTITMLVLFLVDVVAMGNVSDIPRRVFVVAWFILFLSCAMSRLGERILRRLFVTLSYLLSSKAGYKRVMIVGAGYSGYNLVHGMIHSRRRERLPVIIVDDDPNKHNSHIMGIRIVNGVSNIPYLAEAHAIDEITLAMPSADNATLQHVLEYCTQTDCRLTILPPISEVDGVGQTPREVSISDLLHRDEVKLDTDNIRAYIKGACVLITGGGGSIGSEICRQLVKYKPRQIVIVDIYENNAFDLVQELNEREGVERLIFRVASIRDAPRMRQIFEEFRPDVVFHAAAHKHVSTMEDSPAEAIKNNVFGTLNVIKAAIAYETGRFVLISSDKAVNPTNIYGATKRIAELVMQKEAQKPSKTLLCAVRFGNVLGSQGSIIPKFKRQIANGGPVTVYSKEAERFFMTISEACQLVLQAGGQAESSNTGYIFILDMGKPVNIDDLAKKLIRLSGYRPNEDIKILYTTLPPGEKIIEELILSEENAKPTKYGKILSAPPLPHSSEFDRQMKKLWAYSQSHPNKIPELLQKMDLHYKV